MTNSNKITQVEWVSILFSGTLFSMLSYSKFTAGKTNILLFAVSQAVSGAVVFILSVPLKKYFGRSSEGIILRSKSVKPNASLLYSVIYSLYFMYVSSQVLIIGTLFIKNYVDNYLITVLFISVTVICGYFSAVRGIKGIAGSTVLLAALSGAAVLFIFIFSVLINILVESFGIEKLSGLIFNKFFIGQVLTGLIGLIPNCAASIVLTEMYLTGVIGFGQMMSGLLVGAGVGIMVLIKNNKNAKENLRIIITLYLLGVLFGTLLEFLPASLFA